MTKITKESKKIHNGLRALVDSISNGATRLDYAKAVVDYLSKPENGEFTITRNNVYLLVNDFVRITPGNIHIAKAVKAVVEKFQKELAELKADTEPLTA